jgi:hypothetical protein
MSFSHGFWSRMGSQLADLTTYLAIATGITMGIVSLLAIVTGLAR